MKVNCKYLWLYNKLDPFHHKTINNKKFSLTINLINLKNPSYVLFYLSNILITMMIRSNHTILLLIALLLSTVNAKTQTHQQSDTTFLCCPEGYIFDDDTLACICPPATPYIDVAGKCVACPAPSGWNNVTLTCVPCQNPGVWNSSTLTCTCPASVPYLDSNGNCGPCLAPQFWNCKTNQCINCLNTFVYNTTLNRCLCPNTNPFLTYNNTCVACDPTKWDSRNRKCVICSSGLVFDTISLHCISCPSSFIYDTTLLKCKCPDSTPNLNSLGTCVSCQLPQYWNQTKKACVTSI